MKYIDMLLYHDIKPILVFDGRNLPSKAETEKKRRENRRANKDKAVQLLSEGKSKEARDYFQRCVDITPQMQRKIIELFFLIGLYTELKTGTKTSIKAKT